MVSNLGVRQLARWMPAVDCLEAARKAAPAGLSVVLDGGIRNGGDVIVVRALGADIATMVRPVVLALAGGGEAGVRALLTSLIDEVATIASWMGAARLADLGADSVRHVARIANASDESGNGRVQRSD
jgi:isopentenyl diphosphate isomerase/L-lactate dehydrogenase-like FMN-dependent dehydrogenase